MKSNRPSIDGFVHRRIGSQLGELHGKPTNRRMAQVEAPDRTMHTGDDTMLNPIGTPRVGQSIGRSDIDESLREIDNLEPAKKLTRRQRRRIKKNSKPKSKLKRIIKWFFILLLIAAIGIGGFIGIKALIATSSIFGGSIFDFAQNKPLQQDVNGRTNILILGTSQDDPGHQGGDLTDSMLILSIDQTKKNAYMISIPRDLWVKYGAACPAGYEGKINAYYSCVTNGTTSDNKRAALAASSAFVGTIFGLDIQYGVNIDYTVFRDVVNAVGGHVTVDIQGDGSVPAGVKPGSVMDSNFDWKCGATRYARMKSCPPNGHFIDYGPGPVTLDAEHALYLAQARGDIAPTWGLAQSNFDREANQRKLLVAIREKAASGGFITNPSGILDLINSLGDNLHTTFQVNEIRTLISLAQDINSNDIKSISLNTSGSSVMTTGDVSGQSVVEPVAGIFNYSDLQSYIKQQLSSDPVVRENSKVVVLNGSSVAGAAQSEADKLQTDGLIIGVIDTAPNGTYDPIDIYVIDKTKTATLAKLKTIYPNAVIKTTSAPVTVDSLTGFVVVVGPAAAPTPTK
jgi:anionic cell wall polymer biosynthesis LytR-Cps2A-Psr (LCP) family protein